jgi:hypothetical protein
VVAQKMSGGKKSLIARPLADAPRQAPTGLSTGSVDDSPHLRDTLSRAAGRARIDATFQAISAANPRQCSIAGSRRPRQLK